MTVEPNERGSRLVSATEIAQIARVQPSAVSNWRKRYSDFPAPAGTAPSGGDLFLLADVERWLASRRPNAKRRPGDAIDQLWAVADRLRGRALHGDLLGAVAAGAALLHLGRTQDKDPMVPTGTSEVDNWTTRTIARIVEERPDLHELFSPLLALDPPSLTLLLDSLGAFETQDELAAALDEVLERAARYSEFRTSEVAAKLLARLADPRGTTFDPAAGAAELLIRAAEADDSVVLYGQELNQSMWRIAVARLLLRDLAARIEVGDSLFEDRFPQLRADVVLCDPPAGRRTPDLGHSVGDPRWELLGSLEAPPARAAEYAWLAHIIHHLSDHGRGYVLLPTGSLFRGGTEARLRAELLRRGTIEAVITLPRGSTSTATTIAIALWIVRRPTHNPTPVLLIDATSESQLGEDIQIRLVDAVRRSRRNPYDFAPVPTFATTVPVLELLAGDADIVPSRWLFDQNLIDVDGLIAQTNTAQRQLARAHSTLPHDSPTFAVVPTREPFPKARVRDLVELGRARLVRPVRVKTDAFGEEGLPVWLPADIHERSTGEEPGRFLDPALADPRSITEPGDIVFTTIGPIRTRVDETGGHVLGTSLQALRLHPNTSDPHAVAALLTTEANRRLVKGTTIPRVNVLELELPLLDLATARRLGELVRSLEHEVTTLAAVSARASELQQALVDALGTGTTAFDDDTEDADA
jgi:hypothetical protein